MRLPKTADDNKRPGDIKNEGRKELENVSVYADNGYLKRDLGIVEGDKESNWDRIRPLLRAADLLRDKVLRARKNVQRRVCSYGGFGYAGTGGRAGPLQWESLAVIEYDSALGGSHGGILAAGTEHVVAGVESIRTWSDWKEHTGPIALGGKEFPAASKTFGKQLGIRTKDFGGLLQYEDGTLSIGLYGGLTTGSRTSFGGGGYLSLSWTGCSE